MDKIAENYWAERFTVGTQHHSNQNQEVSEDFIKNITPGMANYFIHSSNIIEIGCGTGEMSSILSHNYLLYVLGTDLSPEAISFANEKYGHAMLKFKTLDVLNDSKDAAMLESGEKYDLAMCSNTLEHFKNPYVVIDKMLGLAKVLVILVPYNQPCTDGYEVEGGAGHVFQFTEQSFDKYKVLESFKFKTNGWQHSAMGEDPLQYVVALTLAD